MPTPYNRSLLTRLADHPVARIVAYYVVLAVAVFALHSLDPELQGVFSADRFRELTSGGGSLTGSGKGIAAITLTPWEVTKEVLVAMVGSYLVMLPVAWVYMLTRSKKGYQQALVQTLP